MTEKVLFITDTFENLNFKKDTSILMIEEALKKEMNVFQCEINDLFVDNNDVLVNCREINSLSEDIDTEVKNSILLPGSKAPHFNYVGDSILGRNVNLGAGTKLSNIRHDRREILVKIENRDRVNTGLRKFGALIGENSQLGCNVVTNPGSILATNSMVPPNETVTGWFQN
jgi:NDP-sugar pyrophosphorylase family protein